MRLFETAVAAIGLVNDAEDVVVVVVDDDVLRNLDDSLKVIDDDDAIDDEAIADVVVKTDVGGPLHAKYVCSQ